MAKHGKNQKPKPTKKPVKTVSIDVHKRHIAITTLLLAALILAVSWWLFVHRTSPGYINANSFEGEVLPSPEACAGLLGKPDQPAECEGITTEVNPNVLKCVDEINAMVVTPCVDDSSMLEEPANQQLESSVTTNEGTVAAQNTKKKTSSCSKIFFPLEVKKSEVRNRSIFRGGTTSRGGHPYIAYDIYVKAGTRVQSMTCGVVSKISRDRCGGAIVGIISNGVRYSYMHLNPGSITARKVRVGTPVRPGFNIGTVGATRAYSCSTVDHLHIDVIRGNERLACSRLSCSASVRAKFVSIGPSLYRTYSGLNP